MRDVPSNGRDVVARIERYEAGREPERLGMMYQKMRASSFAFLRATAHVFWADWPRGGPLDEAPLVWTCGDLHLENFGSYRGDNRLAYFDLNDFDEAALAPATWEVARCLTSIHVAADAFGLSAVDATTLCQTFVDAWSRALADGKARWIERATATGMIRELLGQVKRRTRRELLDERTRVIDGRRTLRTDGRHALPLTRAGRAKAKECLRSFAGSAGDPDFYRVLDVARRVAGTASLGLERYVILVHGRGSPNGNFLLDLKEARPSALAPFAPVEQPLWPNEAQRVVSVQRRMQAISPALLHAVRLGRTSYVLRELQPSADRLELENAHGEVDRLCEVMRDMGDLAAWSQLRSTSRDGSAGTDALIAFASSRTWRRPLLSLALAAARQVKLDWQAFVAAGPHERSASPDLRAARRSVHRDPVNARRSRRS